MACSDPVPGQCPSTEVHIPWSVWWLVNLWQPLIVQLVVSLLFLLLFHPAYVERYYRRNSGFQRFVKTYIGTSDRPKVSKPLSLVVLYTLQTCASITAVGVWIWQTYMQDTTVESRALMMWLAHMDMVGWAVSRLSRGCTLACLWEINALVDLLTGVPVLVRGYLPGLLPDGYNGWLTLHFLRSYSVLHSFERARCVAQLDEHTAGMAQGLMQLVLRVAALLTLMAGTIFTFEVLGDPPWLYDSYLETRAGSQVSFFQMVYWIVVTITTVGYGDFAPSTIITRTLTTGFIVIGVGAIYFIQYSFAQMRSLQHEGTGKYRQQSWGRERHVVVILCHRGSALKTASLIRGFLQELLHNSHSQLEDHYDHASSVWAHLRLWFSGMPPRHVQTWPDVVFLSPTRWDEERQGSTFRDFLNAVEDFPSRMQRRVWFLVGEVTSQDALERARVRDSALTYVLSDLQSHSPEEDDSQTIYSALCIRHFFPDVRLRLMVIKPESKELAVQSGIEATRVISSHELSASLLAQNVRCRGLITAVTAMMKSADDDDQEFFLRIAVLQSSRYSSSSAAPWGAAPNRSNEFATRRNVTSLANCRSLDDIEKVLRKSQTEWCPEKQAYERRDPWMFEFFEGAGKAVFGFDLHAQYGGLSYGRLVVAIYQDCGALLLGVQSCGRVVLCPQGQRWRAKAGQICFAIGRSAASLDPCRLNVEDRTSWRNRFQAARRKRRNEARSQGPHVAAARLMGSRLRHSLLQPPYWQEEATGKLGGGSSPAAARRVLWSGRRPPSPAVRPFAKKLLTLKEELLNEDLQLARTPSGESCPKAAAPPQLPSDAPALQAQDTSGGRRPGELAEVGSSSTEALEQVATARALRQSLASGEELVVLIVCHGETWQQVRTFVDTLRQPYLPCLQSVVVLAPTRPPPGLLENDARVVCVQGSCLAAQSLMDAGVLEAAAVVVLTGEAGLHKHDIDTRMVLTAHELECWLGPSSKEVFTTFELHDSNHSARHLPRLHGRLSNPDQGQLTLPQLLRQSSGSSLLPSSPCAFMRESVFMRTPSGGGDDDRDETDESPRSDVGRGTEPGPGGTRYAEWDDMAAALDEESDEDEKRGSGIEDSGHDCHSSWAWLRLFGQAGAELERSHDSIMYHQRFAAGQVFTPELWGLMLGRMFYMPAVIELMEALVMPSRRDQHAYPWQVRVPATYIGQPFRELLSDLAHGVVDRRDDEDDFGAECSKGPLGPPAVPLALYRLREDFSKCEQGSRMRSRSSRSSGPAATPGGIPHRLTARDVTDSTAASSHTLAEGTGGHHFIVLAPPADMILRRGDWAVVLGGKGFGQRMHERNLLRGGSCPHAYTTL